MLTSELLASQTRLAIPEVLLENEHCKMLINKRFPVLLGDKQQRISVENVRAGQRAVLKMFWPDNEHKKALLYQFHPGVPKELFLEGLRMSETGFWLDYCRLTEDELAGIKTGLVTLGDLLQIAPSVFFTPLIRAMLDHRPPLH